jgi:mannosyltransferase OCH1-like enzyme
MNKSNMSAPLPKRLGHIWIGPKPAPDRWMQTWPDKHPDWEYTIYDNDFLAGFPFRLRDLINEYWWRGLYAGVQDMMRYEILYAFGGFMADADAICRHPVDELLTRPQAYTVYDRPEGNRWRGVCPILACEPGNAFVGAVIDRLAEQSPALLRKAEVSTGNRFLMRMIRELDPPEDQLTIWPTIRPRSTTGRTRCMPNSNGAHRSSPITGQTAPAAQHSPLKKSRSAGIR